METEVCSVAPSDWAIKTVGEVCINVTSGGTPSRRNSIFYENGKWGWVKTQELRDKWIDDTDERITEEAVNSSSAKVLPQNTVLLAMYGATVGQLGLLRYPMTCNQACCAMVVNEDEADFRYLFYQLLFARPQLKSLASGAAQQNLSGTLVRSLGFPFPKLSEQQAIGRVLGTLDDKIELNRKMNETLEGIVQAIFQSWFIDFDPVRAKMEGRKPSRMDAATAALFPDSFEDSELGEIPKGWAIRPLPEAIDVNPLRSLKKGDVAPYLDMANMPTNSARAFHVFDREFGSGTKFMNGDTLVARITPCLENGKTAFVDFLWPGKIGWGSTEFIVLRPKPPLPSEFAYFLARSDSFRSYAIANMSGTSGRQRVPADCFVHFQICIPPTPIAKAFGEIADGFMKKMKINDQESGTLASLRDTLLPKLISGEIRFDSKGEAACLIS